MHPGFDGRGSIMDGYLDRLLKGQEGLQVVPYQDETG